MEKSVCDLSARKLFNTTDPKTWGMFIGAVVGLYFFQYILATAFSWERDIKLASDHYYQILYIILLTSFLYQLGNFNNTFSWWFVLGMFVGAIGISAIGAIPGFQFSTGSISSLTGFPLVVVSAFALLVVFAIYMTFRYYQKCNMTSLFFILFFVPIAILALGFVLAQLDSSTVEVHLHHWQWAILFVFFARFPGVPWQSFLTGAFVGIILDGIGRYGPDPLFNPV